MCPQKHRDITSCNKEEEGGWKIISSWICQQNNTETFFLWLQANLEILISNIPRKNLNLSKEKLEVIHTATNTAEAQILS